MQPLTQNCPVIKTFICFVVAIYEVIAYIDVPQQVNYIKVIHPRMYYYDVRERREIPDNKVSQENKRKAIDLGDWTVELNADGNVVIAPGVLAEWISHDGTTTLGALQRCEYGVGVVRGLEMSSRAAVTMCGRQIMGYVDVNGLAYFLQPLNGTSDAHILYSGNTIRRRRSSSDDAGLYREGAEWLFNLTDDTMDVGTEIKLEQLSELVDDGDDDVNGNERKFDTVGPEGNFSDLEVDTPKPRLDWLREQSDEDEMGYFYDTAWTTQTLHSHNTRKSKLPPHWLEIVLVVDHTLITFHGKEQVEQYVMALMNIVSAIYSDASLGAHMQLVLKRLIFYEHKKQSVIRPGNARKSLEGVNSWNRRLHLSLGPDEVHHDIAVWLTRADIGGPSGYAPVAGCCDYKRSCALNRDEGLSSAFIIAHEMGHILGLSHDGDKKVGNKCGDVALEGSVMAPMVAATFSKFSWSDCSQREFRKSIKKWSCLSNSPAGLGEIVLNTSLQNTFSMDEQCRMEFGEGFKLCRAFDIVEPCSHLWCGHVTSPLVCKTKKGPPLEGTGCGFDKWCVDGYCQDVENRFLGKTPVSLNPQDGGWSGWAPWGPCSRSCGTGVSFRTRNCTNPSPMYGGRNCEGSQEEWRICNSNICPEPLSDIRAEQCRRLPQLLHWNPLRSDKIWLPYESEQQKKKCKLICVQEGTKKLHVTTENLIDGTPCSYATSDNICVQGICQHLGCDKKLFSKLKLDKCGVCGGNGSECSSIDSSTRRKLKREVSRIAVVPRLAREISIEVNVTLDNFENPLVAFILKNRKKKKYSFTIPNAGIYTEILEGTKFYYRKVKNQHILYARGPVLAEMVILLYTPRDVIEKGINTSLSLKYVIHNRALVPSEKYIWIMGGWGACSASCGGGRRHRTIGCWDKQNNKLARRKHCSLVIKPITIFEQCNLFDCNFQWIAGDWEPCTKSCGQFGVQSRELYCIPKYIFNKILYNNNGGMVHKPWMFMVNPNRCSGMKPLTTRPCRRVPCIVYWVFGEWSRCSAVCGPGLSIRSAECPAPINELNYSCGSNSTISMQRPCVGPYSRPNSPICKGRRNQPCKKDQSKHCSISLLLKYCKLKGYRRFCCKSCYMKRMFIS